MLKKQNKNDPNFTWYSQEKKVIHKLTANKILRFLNKEKNKHGNLIDLVVVLQK